MPQADVKIDLWSSDSCERWESALESYPETIAARGNEKLANLDNWYRTLLPELLAGRPEPYLLPDELAGIAAWKMIRGTWRERNRVLIAGNDPDTVIEVSRRAFKAIPDPREPVALLSKLAGVGPATASAALAVLAPEVYPFFDELVAAQIDGLGPVAFTAKYYAEYAERLRQRAGELSALCARRWTAHDLAQALWSAASAAQPA